ncbi:MAG TPA: hypothetical protein VKQ36_11805 [Ktedonobacterales bacterium]|nr:hypothetical protein [Ktedonobacterales bacterium]
MGASVASWVGILLAISPPLIILLISGFRAHAADQRASRLLRELLSEAEYRQLVSRGYLEVSSPGVAGRVYRIPRQPGRVAMYEQGARVAELCLQPVKPLPSSDLVVMHKLLIQGNEQAYLQTANHFRPGVYTFPTPPPFLWY